MTGEGLKKALLYTSRLTLQHPHTVALLRPGARPIPQIDMSTGSLRAVRRMNRGEEEEAEARVRRQAA